MTGTGTQTDPYIISSYGELEELCNDSATDGCYIAFSPIVQTIDMNNIYPEGCPTLNLGLRRLNGNGWIIRNLYTTNTWITFGASGGYNPIENLNVLNFYHNTTDAFIGGLQTNYYLANKYLYKCAFSGKMLSSDPFPSNGWTPLLMQRCSFNIEYIGTSSFTLCTGNRYSTGEFMYNNIKIIVGETAGTIMPFNYTTLGVVVSNNLFDITAPTSTVYIGGSTSAPIHSNVFIGNSNRNINLSCGRGYPPNIYNSDTFPVTTDKTGLIGCTTAELQNVEYLVSIGFPIGVD